MVPANGKRGLTLDLLVVLGKAKFRQPPLHLLLVPVQDASVAVDDVQGHSK